MASKKTALLAGMVACVTTGCAAPAERLQDSAGRIADRVEFEIQAHGNRQFNTWRALRGLDERYACILSKGAIARNATPEERAELDAVEC